MFIICPMGYIYKKIIVIIQPSNIYFPFCNYVIYAQIAPPPKE